MGRQVQVKQAKTVIAIDPGKTTGFAVITYAGESPALLVSRELGPYAFAMALTDELKAAKEAGVLIDVVCERFVINAQTIKNSQAPFSLEQIGIMKYVVHSNGLDPEKIYFQSPSDAKKLFSNDALKKLGFWHVGGGGHALDAMRHGLLRIAKTGWVPRALLE
jgi:hypothetical protein